MPDIHVFFLRVTGDSLAAIADADCQGWLQQLPAAKQQRLRRLQNESARRYSLLGTQLLKRAAASLGHENFRLQDLHYPGDGKPCWHGDASGLDFNISHTAGLVVLALGRGLQLGVDAEAVRPLRRHAFRRILSPEQIETVAAEPRRFFDFWAQKEAVVKAAGKAGAASMRAVVLKEARAVFDGREWYLYRPRLPAAAGETAGWQDDYALWLACNRPAARLHLYPVGLDSLLNEARE